MKATSQVAFVRMPKIHIRSYRISLAIMSHDSFTPDLGFIACRARIPITCELSEVLNTSLNSFQTIGNPCSIDTSCLTALCLLFRDKLGTRLTVAILYPAKTPQ